MRPHASAPGDGERIATTFAQLTRGTRWELVGRVPLQFDAHHPQGIACVGDRFVLSAVEVTEPPQRHPPGMVADGTDRTPGRGVGHLIAFDDQGRRLADVRLGDGASAYHPGGLDYDGRSVWVAVSEYRPNRPSIVYRVDGVTLFAHEALRTRDHLGAIAHDARRGRLLGLNWGSRVAYEWKRTRRGWRLTSTTANPSHLVDYQDGRHLGTPPGFDHPVMLCGGIARLRHPGPDGTPVGYDLGAVALVDTATMRPLHAVPFQEYTDQHQVATRNAIDVQVVDGRLRLYLVADDGDSDLLIYEAR